MQQGRVVRKARALRHLSLLAARAAAPEEAAAACGPAQCVTSRPETAATQHSNRALPAGLIRCHQQCKLRLLLGPATAQCTTALLVLPALCNAHAAAFANPASGPSTGSSCCRCERAKFAWPACIRMPSSRWTAPVRFKCASQAGLVLDSPSALHACAAYPGTSRWSRALKGREQLHLTKAYPCESVPLLRWRYVQQNNQPACVPKTLKNPRPTCWRRLRTKAPMLPGAACAPLAPALLPPAGTASCNPRSARHWAPAQKSPARQQVPRACSIILQLL